MSRLEDKFRSLGEELPPAKSPVANYLGCKRSGEILYVSARVSRIRGEVGTEVDVPRGQQDRDRRCTASIWRGGAARYGLAAQEMRTRALLCHIQT